MRALIVDDSLINLKVAEKMLEREGLKVDAVTSGAECLKKVKECEYDVIFMDIMMPEMDGVETYNKLKETDDFNTPVVTLTADAELGSKEKYLSLGFNDYISKPIKQELLHNILEKIKNEKSNP